MKKSVLGAVVILVMVATACTQAVPSPTAPPAVPVVAPTSAPPSAQAAATAAPAPAVAKPTGELKLAVSSLSSEDWDPTKASVNNKFYHRLVFDSVVGSDAVANAISKDVGIARDWQLSPDAMKLTLNLRKGVKFHNGQEVTAEDVKFDLERLLSPKGMASFVAAFRDAIKDITVPDPYTLVINMKAPSPLLVVFLSPLAGGEGEVYPKKYIEEKGEDYFLRNPVGSGPYKFVEHVAGSRITLEAFEDYWRGAPKYKRVTVMALPEESTRITMLKRGEVDVIEVSRENLGELTKAGFNVFTKEGSATYKISFELGKTAAAAGAAVTKLPVRRALSLAINRKEIADTLFYGRAKPSGTQFSAYAQEWEPLAPDPYDPQKAKQLLAEAGYPQGFSLEFLSFPVGGFPEQIKINEAVAGYWSAIGVNVKLMPVEFNVHVDRLRKGETQRIGTVNGYPQQSQYLTLATYQGSLHPKGRNGYIGQGDDYLGGELATLIDKAAATIDEKERVATLKQVAKNVYDNMWVIPLVEVGSPFATKADIKEWELGMLPYDFNFPYLVRTWKP